ncbi:MAG: recombinase zinc beta ribbon domain-containing protein [Lactococcus raffinolactis]|uniref:recombinase zinc beta ribbon domain-containing protein n=1 Tax=Pseudolactococcus raffinolactis TaxID=1366 RepID=UPI003993330F
MVNFKTYKKSYKSKKCLPNPSEKWKIFPGHHEAIIDKETFDLVQKMRNSRRTRQTHNKRIGLFSGITFCADCGYKHHYDTHENYKNYFCSGRASRLRYCESYHWIREKDLAKAVADDFAKIQAKVNEESGDFVAELHRKFASDDLKKVAEMERKFHENETRILELDSIISRLYEDNVSGKISDERFAKMSEDFEKEQRNLKIQNIAFREKITKIKADCQNVDNFVKLAKSTVLL